MVLESLVNPLTAEKRPSEMFLIGFLYSSIGIFLSMLIFKDQASLVMVFLTVMACVPIVYNTLRMEESKDTKTRNEAILLKEHWKAIKFLMYLFLGITLSCTLWYTFLPADESPVVFEKQISTIQAVNGRVTGFATQKLEIFSKIFFNNMMVLVFSIVFSFIYGAGAIFILTWNATVIGAAMGNTVKSYVASSASVLGFPQIGSYFVAIPMSFLKYAIHGIPEIMGYFYGGLAGGIISVALIRHHFSTKNFSTILTDSSELVLIAVGFLFVAALIEVFITPVLF